MEPLPDYFIELLVRHPTSLSDEMRRTVEEYVAKDPFGKAVAQFYRAYYEELDLLDAGRFRRDRHIPGVHVPIERKKGPDI